MREAALYSRPPCPVEAGLSLALCFEQDRVESLAGGLTGPDHELERLEISLAGFDRDPQHGFALSVGRISSARRRSGTLRSKAQAICMASTSSIHVKATS